jgi:hypothetical protein
MHDTNPLKETELEEIKDSSTVIGSLREAPHLYLLIIAL